MEIHDRLRRAREAAGFDNASEFARRIEVAPNSVYRYERGDQSPSLAIAGRWASETGVSLDWLVKGEGDGPSDRPVLAATGTDDPA